MLIIVSFAINRNWKQPTYLPTGEWITTIWCIHTMEYSSAMKTTDLLNTPVWVIIKIMMVNERSQAKEYVLYGSIYIKF